MKSVRKEYPLRSRFREDDFAYSSESEPEDTKDVQGRHVAT